jgi:protein gp37
MAGRLKLMGQPKYQNDGDPRTSGPGFAVTCHPDTLNEPLRWKKPRRVFVNSMSDLFHPDVPTEFILRVFSVMSQAPQHTFQILTKRPQRMYRVVEQMCWANWQESKGGDAYLLGGYDEGDGELVIPGEEPLENVWLGTSIENDRYTFRGDHLRATPAAVRFLSLEPLLGPLPSLNLDDIDWVIVGAESGRGARPMDLGWVRDIRDRCVDAGIPFFFKQDAVNGRKLPLPVLDGRQWAEYPEATR